MDGGYFPAVQPGNVPQMFHIWKVPPGNGDRGFFYLAGPYWRDPVTAGRQRKHTNAVKQTAECKHMRFTSHGGISFTGGGGHEFIQLRILGNGVGEGHQGAADPQQSMPRLGVGDVAHLRVGDMQQLCQLRPVGGRLIEQQ